MTWTELAVAVCVALVTPLASSSCSDRGSEWCPSGWVEPDDGTCRAPEGFEAALADEIGTGVYGWARMTEGNCMPSWCAAGRDCSTSLEPGVEIAAYGLTDVVTSGATGTCYARFELADGATAAGIAVVDADGIYRMQLPAGDYALTSTDPFDGCPFIAGTAHIDADTPVTCVNFYFDHGAY